MRARLAGLAAALLSIVSGCNDYSYEELSPSVLHNKRHSFVVNVYSTVDILFVIDNSGSMAGEQVALAESFSSFAERLDLLFGPGKYQVGVITTGMFSEMCCPFESACKINASGESGRLQDRLGRIVDWESDPPVFDFRDTQGACRIIGSDNQVCFYDTETEPPEGVALVGVEGCGIERGLAAVRAALDRERLAGSGMWNAGFLRDEAILAVVVVSDEEDCGEVGDVMEGGDMCYYAAAGVDGEGRTSYLDEGVERPYALTPVEEYHRLLTGLKGDRPGMVKFAAIVGVDKVDEATPGVTIADLDNTRIRYEADEHGHYLPSTVCATPGCTGQHCEAYPGTRYIELARLFGLEQGGDGFVGSICHDFSETLEDIATFVACPRTFYLSEPILDPGLANIFVNGEAVPRHSCALTGAEAIPCAGPGDASCSGGAECVETWSYFAAEADEAARIAFASHYDPCELIEEGEIHIELVYATE
ncbi:MAG: hypothetical protein JXR96_03770 [Deltaproteobacteria bacterium]|nr:hypothetical protein [Deltaproteobacteria bacterium]